jgi:RHS repeat-associated protein
VITDKKIPYDDGTRWKYYTADVVSTQDYYAFGQGIEERGFSRGSSKYRYSYNGKETDDETGIQDYGFRMYDSRLCRFLSVDPLAAEYPWYTPYQFAGNKPIQFVDLDGLEEAPANKGTIEGQKETTYAEKDIGELGTIKNSGDWYWHTGGKSGKEGWYSKSSYAGIVKEIGKSHGEVEGAKLAQPCCWNPNGKFDINEYLCTGNIDADWHANFGDDYKEGYSEGVRHAATRGMGTVETYPIEFDIIFGLGGSTPGRLAIRMFFARLGAKEIVETFESRIFSFTESQIQMKFKHAGDFGVFGNWSKANGVKFGEALTQHINAAGTEVIAGSYRNANSSALFYINRQTGLGVVTSRTGEFIYGAKWGPKQIESILTRQFLW